ncbi:unnamed protein product [Psylliodes chrysocephalus]|uniref:Uncharacterized protein n=1 Tax=Psylliodes chrysocephalus TaxID=3402493 RepID=A0A9P0CR80_9CUCU|nr:unnamed protein product [Psylliodes chrysocephala]
MMTSFLLFLSICLIVSTNSSPLFEFSGNEPLLGSKNNADNNCCSVSHCKEIPLNTEGHNVFKCFKTDVCGDECFYNQKKLSAVSIHYRRKNYYVKKICQLDQCEDYIFDCRRCPDPKRNGFNTYDIDNSCINCYY